MKKILLLLTLISFSAISQNNPALFRNGVETIFTKYRSYTTAERDALTLGSTDRRIIHHLDTGINQYEQWDGDSWEEIGAAPDLSGYVTKLGTPVDDQIAIWTSDGVIEGNPNFELSGTGARFKGANSFLELWNVSDRFTLSSAGRSLSYYDGAWSNTLQFEVTEAADYIITVPHAQGTMALTSDISSFETTTQLNTRDTNNRNRANHTGTQTASTISDFDTEVSNNTDVEANTSARHTAVSVLDSGKIDLGLTGQQVTADIISGTLELTDLTPALQTTIAKIDVNEADIAALETNKLDTSLLIDDDTFASATSSNIPSAESVKNYVDASNGSIDTNPRAAIATEGEYTEVYNESAPNFKIPITGDTDISVTSLESGDYGMVIADNTTSTPYKVRLTTSTDTLSNILISEKAYFSHFTDSTGTTWFRSYEDGKINHLITKTATTGFTDIDWSESAIQTFQFGTANDTLSFIPPKYPTNDLKLIVKQGATGGDNLAYTNDVEVIGSLPTLTATANAVDIITYIYDGEKYYLYDIKKDFETVAGVDPYVPPLPEPILRINAGGALITATDAYVDWEDGTTGTGVGFTSSGGAVQSTSSITWAKHSSVLDLPDADIQTLYDTTRYTNGSVTYNVPVSNGTYTVRIFLGFHEAGGTVTPLNIIIEGVTLATAFNPVTEFGGYRTMGSVEYEVTVADASLTIVIQKHSQTNQLNHYGISIKQ